MIEIHLYLVNDHSRQAPRKAEDDGVLQLEAVDAAKALQLQVLQIAWRRGGLLRRHPGLEGKSEHSDHLVPIKASWTSSVSARLTNRP